MKQRPRTGLVSVSILCVCAGISVSGETKKSFYKGPALFSTRPSETKSVQSINRFGPVGMGIELHQPAFVMKIKNIEKGSPAEATGKFKKGQIIETINGQKLADIDPRMQLANILGKAGATDGVLKFRVKDKPDARVEEVIVKIPVLGAYSKTWPLNCPKSDRIVRNFAEYLAAKEWGGSIGLNGPEMLFMLSTGEEKDLNVVREWIKKTVALYEKNAAPNYAWFIGYGGPPLAEYYLRTGDKAILPVIRKFADSAKDIYYLGGWSGRGSGNFPYMGGGHMNAAGAHVVTFLLLAKECGVDVDEVTLQGSLKQFYRYAGRGNNPYGDGRPEIAYVDNGKTGVLAFPMAAAASLTPNGEQSVYARARDVSAVKSFYSASHMLHGHTGGGIGEIWRGAAMGFMVDKKPKKYREFMDNRMWFYDLSRRYDGSFGILGGGGYDKTSWGVTMGLSYTMPRKTLRLTGASPTKYSKKYQLPERPWGTKADDVFLSIEAAVDKDGKSPEIDSETFARDSAGPLLARLAAKDVSEETVRSYAHHPDHGVRRAASMRVAGQAMSYIGWNVNRSAKPLYPGLVTELLKSKDPRVRWAGVNAVAQLPQELLTDEVFDLLMAMIHAPDESWWIVDHALRVVGKGKPELIAPHIDRLLEWLEHDDWWLRSSAIEALLPVAADEKHHAKIFPVLGRVIATNHRFNTLAPLRGLSGLLRDASPKVQKAALEMFGQAYAAFPVDDPNSDEVPNVNGDDWHLKHMATYMSGFPGGLDTLYEVSKKRHPEQALPHRELYLGSNDLASNPKAQKVLRPITINRLIPELIGKNRAKLLKETAAEVQSAYPQGYLDQLTALYRKAGINDYDWHLFGPDLRNAEWSYHTFDPIPEEQVPWDMLITRYRDVTFPKGLEKWFSLDFDAQKAGWKRGISAFGQWDGKIPEYKGPCSNPMCFGRTEVKTLWDKEVLLLRGTFTIPPMKEGRRYRLRVNDGDHVGSGGGYIIYINGKKLIEQPRCAGRGQGAKPKGAFITKEFLKDFQGGKVTIAVKSFIRFNHKYKVKPTTRIPQGRISLHFEEMKIPPVGQAEMIKSATVVPMFSTKWQATQEDADKFLYDGKFVINPQILGSWKIIDQVKTVQEFNLEKRMRPGRANITRITFKDKGKTDEMLRIWSGDTLMDLTRNQALKMTVKTIGGSDYLFIEAGGFKTRNPKGWQPPLYVMKRAAD